MENNELQHWGIKGMKWGVRRYQNSDGTLTAAGKKRYNKELAKLREEKKVLENKRKTQAKMDKLDAMRKEIDDMKSGKKPAAESGKKSMKDMSNEELSAAITRAQLEKNYRDLHPAVITRVDRFIGKLKDGAVDKGADLAINIGHDYIDKVARETLGLGKKNEPSTSEQLKNLVTDLRNKRDAEELKDDEYQKLKRDAAKSNFEKQIRDNENAKKASEKQSNEEKKKEETPRSEPKSEPKREEKTVYEGTVVGEGTSKGNFKKSDTGPVVDVDWKDVTVSNVPAVYTRTGQDFVDDFLNKRK